MTHQRDIWECILNYLPRGTRISLAEIYKIVEENLNLDEEDFDPQSPSSSIPKWKRNVRNVLQPRKHKGEIKWEGRGEYYL